LNSFYRFAADLVLYLHVTFVAFVIGALVLIFVGRFAGWPWIRNGWFRLVHLIAIGIVVLQAWLGVICPLTTLEMWLRTKAGDAVYPGAFVAHWVQRILYYDAPAWVFALLYTAFGALVVASWIWIRPQRIRTGKGERDGNISES
jgi:multisubunit Na+/H+ antiporter MnhB subunit